MGDFDDIPKMLGKAQAGLLRGTDDAAKMMIAAGSFVVIADMGFRLAHLEASIQLPDAGDIWDATKSAFLADGLVGYFTKLMPKINIESEGLWEWKWTCYGFGILTAGVGLLIANHPEWITTSIDRAQEAKEEAKALFKDIVSKVAETDGAEGVEKLTDNIGPLLAVLTATPIVPPPP